MSDFSPELSQLEKDIFEQISKNQLENLKYTLSQHKGSVDFLDENRMTPLQHACFKGNAEIVQLLLDLVICIQASNKFNDF